MTHDDGGNNTNNAKGGTGVKKIIEWFETHKAPPWWTGPIAGALLSAAIAAIITLITG